MKKFLGLAAKLAISFALLYFAVGRVNFSILAERLARLEIGWLLAAIAIVGMQTVVVALRWREVGRVCGFELPVGRAFRFTMVATFFNQTLPSTVGGDAARIWLAASDGAGWTKATYSVLIDRVGGVLTLAIIVLVCMPWSFQLIQNPIGRAALLLIGIGCIVGPAVFVACGYLRWALLERWWLTQHFVSAAQIARGLLTTRTGILVLAFSVAIHMSTVLTAFCAARSVAAPFELVYSLLLLPPVALISTVPISIAGWGVRESTMVLAFAYAGLPEGDGLLVSVLLGVAMFAVGVVGGIMWLLGPETLRMSSLSQPDKARPAS